eukprot:1320120-Rhodomonas_salina.2
MSLHGEINTQNTGCILFRRASSAAAEYDSEGRSQTNNRDALSRTRWSGAAGTEEEARRRGQEEEVAGRDVMSAGGKPAGQRLSRREGCCRGRRRGKVGGSWQVASRYGRTMRLPAEKEEGSWRGDGVAECEVGSRT